MPYVKKWSSAKWRLGLYSWVPKRDRIAFGGPFKEIFFFDFLEESTQVFIYQVVTVGEGKIEKQDFSFPK